MVATAIARFGGLRVGGVLVNCDGIPGLRVNQRSRTETPIQQEFLGSLKRQGLSLFQFGQPARRVSGADDALLERGMSVRELALCEIGVGDPSHKANTPV